MCSGSADAFESGTGEVVYNPSRLYIYNNIMTLNKCYEAPHVTPTITVYVVCVLSGC